MLRGLSGKAAIVTGGATMIGEAVVSALHEAGVRVMIADIDPKGQAVADRIGDGVLFRRTDITDDDQIAACVEAAAGADYVVDGGYTAMGPEQAVPAIPKLLK